MQSRCCGECGAQVPDEVETCPFCGASLAGAKRSEERVTGGLHFSPGNGWAAPLLEDARDKDAEAAVPRAGRAATVAKDPGPDDAATGSYEIPEQTDALSSGVLGSSFAPAPAAPVEAKRSRPLEVLDEAAAEAATAAGARESPAARGSSGARRAGRRRLHGKGRRRDNRDLGDSGELFGRKLTPGREEPIAFPGEEEALGNRRRERKRAITVAAALVAAILVIAFIAYAVFAFMADRQLAAEAAKADEQSSEQTAAANDGTVDTDSDAGKTASKTGSGGGALVHDAGYLFWADSRGVHAASDASIEQGAQAKGGAPAGSVSLYAGAASNVNALDGTLFYLAGDTDAGSTRLMAIPDAAKRAKKNGKAAAAQTLYDAGGSGGSLMNLVVRGGIAYFEQVDAAGARVLRALAVGGSHEGGAASEPVDLADPEAGAVLTRVFVSDDGKALYWLVSKQGAWTLKQAMASADAGALSKLSFTDAMSGKGGISAAALVGQTLFVSGEGASGASRTSAYQMGGGFTDLSDLLNVVVMAGDSSRCAAITATGGLAYVNGDTNFTHDVTAAAQGALGGPVSPDSLVSVDGSDLYLVDPSGRVARIDVSADPATAKLVAKEAE